MQRGVDTSETPQDSLLYTFTSVDAASHVICIAVSGSAGLECPILMATNDNISITFSPSNCMPGNLHEGCVAIYECVPGLMVDTESPNRRTCVMANATDGMWSGVPPQCVRKFI